VEGLGFLNNFATMYSRATTELEIYRGNDARFVFDFFENSEATPINVAAEFVQIRASIRVRKSSDSRLVLTKTLGNGITISNTNRVTIAYSAAETQAIEAGVYWFDFKTVDAQGLEITYFGAMIPVTDNITL
jgi:hypothetical protein